MNKLLRACFLAILFSFLAFSSSHAVDFVLNKTPAQVYFSPHGGCTEAIVKEINGAKTYSAILTGYAVGRKLQVTGLNLMKRKERKALRQALAP